MVAMKEGTRKGPWTEQEDLQLVCYVCLFGERRWDFIAKVSGLKRTGKSCRLRWVNYLHPGLKHGRLTPQEEHLILELHSKWGNRWSRIAGRLPGRTDNEIKNYWRTYMRKMAQERKRNSSSSSSTSSSCLSFSGSEQPIEETCTGMENQDEVLSFLLTMPAEKAEEVKVYPMDQLWNEIATSESTSGLSFHQFRQEDCNISCAPPPMEYSPVWEYCVESLWKADANESNIIPSMSEHLVSNYQHGEQS